MGSGDCPKKLQLGGFNRKWKKKILIKAHVNVDTADLINPELHICWSDLFFQLVLQPCSFCTVLLQICYKLALGTVHTASVKSSHFWGKEVVEALLLETLKSRVDKTLERLT